MAKNFLFLLIGLLIPFVIATSSYSFDYDGQSYTCGDSYLKSGTDGAGCSLRATAPYGAGYLVYEWTTDPRTYDSYSSSCGKRYKYIGRYYSDCEAAPSEPDHCSNGSKDGDETGLDCGGSCGECDSEGCVPPAVLRPIISGGETTYNCVIVSEPDSFGNCRGATMPTSDSNTCYGVDFDNNYGDPIPFNKDKNPDGIPSPTEPPPTDPPTSGGSYSDYKSPETVKDNGDGTEDVTITHTKTTIDPKTGKPVTTTSKTTVTRPSGSPTGTGFNSDGNGGVGVAPGFEGSKDGEDDLPEEAGGGAGAGNGEKAEGFAFDDEKLGKEVGRFTARIKEFSDAVRGNPVITSVQSVFSLPNITANNPNVSTSFGVYGTHSIDLSVNNIVTSILANIILLWALFRAAKIIILGG